MTGTPSYRSVILAMSIQAMDESPAVFGGRILSGKGREARATGAYLGRFGVGQVSKNVTSRLETRPAHRLGSLHKTRGSFMSRTVDLTAALLDGLYEHPA